MGGRHAARHHTGIECGDLEPGRALLDFFGRSRRSRNHRAGDAIAEDLALPHGGPSHLATLWAAPRRLPRRRGAADLLSRRAGQPAALAQRCCTQNTEILIAGLSPSGRQHTPFTLAACCLSRRSAPTHQRFDRHRSRAARRARRHHGMRPNNESLHRST